MVNSQGKREQGRTGLQTAELNLSEELTETDTHRDRHERDQFTFTIHPSLLSSITSTFNCPILSTLSTMSASPETTVPAESGSVATDGVEATHEAQTQATETSPQEGVNEKAAEQDQEDEAPRPRLAFPPRDTTADAPSTTTTADTTNAVLKPTVHAEEDEDSDEDGLADLVAEDEAASASGSGSGSDNDNEEGEEAYVPATENSAARIPSFKKNKDKKSRESRTEKVGASGEKRSKKSKKSEEVVEDDEVEDEGPLLDEATRRLQTTFIT